MAAIEVNGLTFEIKMGFIMRNVMKKIVMGVVTFCSAVLLYSAVALATTDEFVATIDSVDKQAGIVTFSAKQFSSVDYKVSFDARIRLSNGDIGALANLRESNLVTAVVDKDTKVVYFIQVHK